MQQELVGLEGIVAKKRENGPISSFCRRFISSPTGSQDRFETVATGLDPREP